jgi:hypothetical protein
VSSLLCDGLAKPAACEPMQSLIADNPYRPSSLAAAIEACPIVV